MAASRKKRFARDLEPAGPMASPDEFRELYVEWLGGQGREPVLPGDVKAFIAWWRSGLRADGGGIPWMMTPDQIENWWIAWCHRTERMDLIPFDVRRWLEDWRCNPTDRSDPSCSGSAGRG
jgi:hypothetical protein